MQLKIVELTREITNLIKQGETKLKELCKAETNEKSDEQSKCFLSLNHAGLVRKNMTCILAERLKQVTLSLRKMEKDHFLKVQEMHGEPTNNETNATMADDGDQEMILEEENTHQNAEI